MMGELGGLFLSPTPLRILHLSPLIGLSIDYSLLMPKLFLESVNPTLETFVVSLECFYEKKELRKICNNYK